MKKSIPKTVFRIILYAAGGTIGLLIVVLLLITLPPGEELLRSQLRNRLERQLHQPVRLGAFETNLFSRVRLSGLQVYPRDEQGGDAAPVLAVGNVTVQYDLTRLLSNQLTIGTVTIDSMTIRLRRDATTGFSLDLLDSALAGRTDSVETPDTTAGGLQVRFGTASLGKLDIVYDDRVVPVYARVEGIAADVTTKGEEYQFSLHTGDGQLRYADMPPRRLALGASGRVGGKHVKLDSLALHAVDLALTAAGVIPFDTTKSMDVTVHLQGNPDFAARITQRMFNTPAVQAFGSLRLDATARGVMSQPNVEATLRLPSMNLRKARIQEGLIAGSWDGERAVLSTLRLQTLKGVLEGTGSFTPRGTPGGRGQFALRGLDLGTFWSSVFDTAAPVQGTLSGTVTASGAGTRITGWSATVRLNTEGLTYQQKEIPEVAIGLEAQRGQVHLSAVHGDMNLEAHGQFDDRQHLQGELSLSIPDLQQPGRLLGQPGLRGFVTGGGTFWGTLQQPLASLHLEGGEILYRNLPVDAITADASIAGKKVRIAEARIRGVLDSVDQSNPPFGLDSLRGGIRYEGVIEGPLDSLNGRLAVQLIEPRYGRFGLDRAAVDITIDSQQIIRGQVVLQRDSLGIAFDARYNLDSTRGHMDARTAVIPPGLAWNPGEQVQGGSNMTDFGRIVSSFSLVDNRGIEASARGEGIDLKTFASLFADSLKASGDLAFTLDAAGTTTNPSIRLRAVVTRPQYDTLALDSIAALVRVDNHVVYLEDLTIAGEHQRVRGTAAIGLHPDSSGSYTVTPRSPVRGTFNVEEFNLGFLQAFLPAGIQLAGIATADVRVSGSVNSPHPDGTFALRGVRMVPNENVGPVTLDLRGSVRDSLIRIDHGEGTLLNTPFSLDGRVAAPSLDKISADMQLLTAGKGALRAEGTIGGGQLALKAAIDSLDLSLAAPFVPSLQELHGTLDVDVTAQGSSTTPDIHGFLRVRDLRVRPEMLKDPISQGRISLVFDRSRVRVDTLTALVGGGPLSVTGTLDLEGRDVKDVNMTARLRRVQIHLPDKFIVRIDTGTVHLTRANESYNLAGDLKFGESRLVMNAEPGMLLSSLRSAERVGSATPGFADRTRLQVRVRESDSLWIDNNLAKARLHAEIGLIGTLAQPNISGRLSIAEGEILYLDREFDVKKGIVDFVDPHKFNPIVSFEAQTEVTNYSSMQATTYTINFTAEGEMDKLVTNLTSDPPLENSDIIALLTLGATRTQLTSSSQGGAGDILVERAKVLASEKLSGILSRKAGRALGLDEVSVTGNLFNFSDSWGPGLVLAKQITSRTKVTYSTNVGHMNEQSIRVDYQLTPRFSLEGETSQNGASALSFKYGFRFR